MNKKKNLSSHIDLQKKNETSSRRQFLKKAVYAAPTIIALGHLVRPTNAMAESAQAINKDPNLGHPRDFF